MRLRRFNEADSYDLSFDGFKEVMSDITDDISLNHEFEDNSAHEDADRYYELKIFLPIPSYRLTASTMINLLMGTNDILNYSYLSYEGGLAHPEDGGDTLNNEKVVSCIDKINDANSNLENVKHVIDTQIENNSLIKKLLSDIIKTKDRLSSFDNWKESRLGHDGNIITITFEIK